MADEKQTKDLIPPVVGRAEGMSLMWRCSKCGAMGHRKDGVPEKCPECGAPKRCLVWEEED
jgi:rubrerythrin